MEQSQDKGEEERKSRSCRLPRATLRNPVEFLANTSQLIGLPPCALVKRVSWCKQPQRPLQIPERMNYEESQDVEATRTGSFSVRILKRQDSEDTGAPSVSHCKPGCVCSGSLHLRYDEVHAGRCLCSLQKHGSAARTRSVTERETDSITGHRNETKLRLIHRWHCCCILRPEHNRAEL
ncbi:hypothetical protein NQZ68_024474 [Dissostichus eleginoides]|nr:hypothetical protein NQZ68_024474 [Dissostichus eleginoides]